VVPAGCTHPTGWWGHPNHRQLPREVLGTRDPTTARHIRCLHGAVGLGPSWRRAGLQSAQGRKHAANCNGGRGEDCRGSGGPARLRLRMAILEQNALARKSPCETRVVTTAGLLVLSSQFSHRLVTASLVLQVCKARRCGAVGRKNCIGFIPRLTAAASEVCGCWVLKFCSRHTTKFDLPCQLVFCVERVVIIAR
jgi:hypothetical protein